MGLLRMRAEISCPAQTKQRLCFWWRHNAICVQNTPFSYGL